MELTHFSGHLNTCVKGGKNVCAAQIVEYLHRFVIPEDYQAQILTMYQHLQQAEGDTEGLRRELEGRLERIRDLYEWGDKAKDDYLSESREIKEEPTHLACPTRAAPRCAGRVQGFPGERVNGLGEGYKRAEEQVGEAHVRWRLDQ